MTREAFYSYKKDLAKEKLRSVIDSYCMEDGKVNMEGTLDKRRVIHDLEKLYTDLFVRGF